MEKKNHCRRYSGVLVGVSTAIVIIGIGLLFLGKNLGFVDQKIVDLVFSWPMLLVVIGLIHILLDHFIVGLLFGGVGAFFLVPRIIEADSAWASTWWPVLVILAGILVLLKMIPFFNRKRKLRFISCYQDSNTTETLYDSKDGFIVSENVLGGVHQIVLDPVLRGGRIKSVLGGTVLDLRRTTLELEETFLDIDCVLGGIEIFVPKEWLVVTKLNTSLGGVEDKRYVEKESLDYAHKLILRGRLSLGGIELKN